MGLCSTMGIEMQNIQCAILNAQEGESDTRRHYGERGVMELCSTAGVRPSREPGGSIQLEMFEAGEPGVHATGDGAEFDLEGVIGLDMAERFGRVEVVRGKRWFEMEDEDAAGVVDELHILHRAPRFSQFVLADGNRRLGDGHGAVVDEVDLVIVLVKAAVWDRTRNDFALRIDERKPGVMSSGGDHGRDHANATRFDKVVAHIWPEVVGNELLQEVGGLIERKGLAGLDRFTLELLDCFEDVIERAVFGFVVGVKVDNARADDFARRWRRNDCAVVANRQVGEAQLCQGSCPTNGAQRALVS